MCSEETKQKISQANKNKIKPEGFGEGIRKMHTGTKKT